VTTVPSARGFCPFHDHQLDNTHITIKISGHPPFPAQAILNGHEYVACQACKAAIRFTKESNCFTEISDAVALAEIAETIRTAMQGVFDELGLAA
jgi:hypothetical protein